MNERPPLLRDHPVQVAAAVIRRDDGRVLISLRSPHVHQGGLWEFPGGKVDSSERHVDGLARELEEELGITIERAVPLIRIDHRYPDKHVTLEVLEVEAWQGEPRGREGQAIRWVEPQQLRGFDFPAANLPIRTALELPHASLVVPAHEGDADTCLERLAQCLDAGVRLVRLPLTSPDRARVRRVARRAAAMCREAGAVLMLDALTGDVLASGADGLHLGAARMRQLSARPIGAEHLFSASCHNRSELEHAQRLGADFIYVSPVHAGVAGMADAALGWHRLRRLVRCARVPVFALGGMQSRDTRMARRAGCQGIAMQSGLWWAQDPAAVIRSCADACSGAAYRVRR